MASTNNRPPYLSASQINQFTFCPLAYKYLYIDKVKKDEGSIYSAFGTAIHEALALNYEQKIKSRKDLPTQEVIQKFTEALEQEKERLKGQTGFPVRGSDPWGDMILMGENVLSAYMVEKAPAIQPKHVEMKFELELKKFPITILGYIDLITEDDVIIDHKTTGKYPKKNWNQAKVDDSLQFTLYAAAFRKMFGKKEAGIMASIIPRQHKPEFIDIRSGRSDEQVLHLLEMATTIDEIIEAGIWVPNPTNCKGCPFNSMCPKQVIKTK